MADQSTEFDRQRLAEAVGHLTLRWGDVEGSWRMIFMNLFSIERGGEAISVPVVDALYDSHRNSTSQRAMVLGFASAVLGDSPLVERLRKLNKATEKIAVTRNAFQHTNFMFIGSPANGYRFDASPFGRSRLRGANLVETLKDLDPKLDSLFKDLIGWQQELMQWRRPAPPPAGTETQS